MTTTPEKQVDSDALRQTTVEMWHPGCWALEINNQFSDSHIIEKSTYQADDHIKGDLVFVTRNPREMDELLEAVEAHENVFRLTVLKNAGDRARVLVKYNKEYSVLPTITRSDLMAIEPFHIANGYKYWTVVVRSGELPKQITILKDEYELKIRSTKDFSDAKDVEYGDIVDQIYSSLSERQREVMLRAAKDGYYQWPRNVSAESIAESMGVSGPTFLEHLRKGEQKIINEILDRFEQRHKNKILPTVSDDVLECGIESNQITPREGDRQ